MKEQINNGKGFLKDKLGNYQVDPPEQVWDSISALLGGRGRRRMIILTISAAASIALAVTLGIHYFGPERTDTAGIAEIQDQASQTTRIEPVPEAIPGLNPEIESESITGIEPETVPGPAKGTLEERVIMTMKEIAVEPEKQELAAYMEPDPDPEAAGEQVMEPVIREQPVEQTEMSAEKPLEESSEEPTEKPSEESSEELTEKPLEESSEEPTEEPAEEPAEELPIDPLTDFVSKEQREPRWAIGAAVSPLYSFRDAQSSIMGGGAQHESGLVSYAGGVHVEYRTTSRLAIESGVFYNKMGISIGSPGIQLSNRSYDFAPLGAEVLALNVVAITNSVGNIVSKSGDIYVNSYKMNEANADNSFGEDASTGVFADQGIRQHLDYLEVPFNLRYTVIDRSIELQLVGGISTNLLVNNNVTMETSEGRTDIGYMTNIRSVNYSGNAGLGMVYHIQEQFSLHLEPRFRYFLNSINDTSLPSTRPYAFGIFTGLSYWF